MENLLVLTLEARHFARNHHRRYEVRVGRDLFGEWTVSVRYGRAGRGGQEQHYGGADAAVLQATVRRCLRRRLSAPRRIGCAYCLTRFASADCLDVLDWVPVELMAEFLPARDGTDLLSKRQPPPTT